MLRAAQPGDEAAIEAFLARHAETSMFLRSNMRRFGLEDREAPHATRYWLAGGAEIAGVFGFSNAGFAMTQAPQAPPEFFDAFAARIAGRTMRGIIGLPDQVTEMKRATGTDRAVFTLDSPEPLYRLALAKLRIPDGPGSARAPVEADRGLLEDWHRAYVTELRMTSPELVDSEARDRAGQAITDGHTKLLVVDGTPVCRTQFNARLPDIVQIGGVYTPPGLRGRGHARRVVALHLAEARTEGVDTAILFASGPAACRAYEAIGFVQIGAYMLSILKQPITVGAGR